MMRLWTIAVTVAFGLGIAFTQGPISNPLLNSDWPTWGRDMRRSHFANNVAGPNRPAVLWFARGGALEEPAIPGNRLWVPQHPDSGSRYTRYTIFEGATGFTRSSIGPFWGQPATPIFVSVAVYYVDDLRNRNQLRPPTQGVAYMLSGGQYDSLFVSPSPVDGFPDFSITLRGVPAYRTGFGAVTDSSYTYPIFADNFGRLFIFYFAWIVDVDQNNPLVVEGVAPDFGIVGDIPLLSAVLSSVSSDQSGSLVLLGLHNGIVEAFRMTNPRSPQRAWTTSIQSLSNGGISSDTIDRPVAVTSNNQIAIVCGSNSGRVYGVRMTDGIRLWEYRADNQSDKAVMGGPSIGPDPNNANEDTVYIVVRDTALRSAVHAIRASNGTRKWVYTLPNLSRCTPTIDQNGVVYLGDDRGFLYAINPDGRVKWRFYLGAPIRVAPVLGRFTIRGQPTPVMFVAAANRFLYAIVDQLSFGSGAGSGIGGIGSGISP